MKTEMTLPDGTSMTVETATLEDERECPACKERFAPGVAPHKLCCYDLDPNWGMGPRFWMCAASAVVFKRMLESFDAKTDPMDWHRPGLVRK
jgi:hypothetical protein